MKLAAKLESATDDSIISSLLVAGYYFTNLRGMNLSSVNIGSFMEHLAAEEKWTEF